MAAMNIFQTSMLYVVSVREISGHEMMGLRYIYLKRHCQIALAKIVNMYIMRKNA